VVSGAGLPAEETQSMIGNGVVIVERVGPYHVSRDGSRVTVKLYDVFQFGRDLTQREKAEQYFNLLTHMDENDLVHHMDFEYSLK
jgi:hypothetical protein